MTAMNWEVAGSCYLLRPDSCRGSLYYYFTYGGLGLGAFRSWLKSDGGDVLAGSVSVHGI